MSSREQHAVVQQRAAARINREWPDNATLRAFECFLLRMVCASDSPMVDVENTAPGNGILVAYDAAGRQFKIEISQVGGPP